MLDNFRGKRELFRKLLFSLMLFFFGCTTNSKQLANEPLPQYLPPKPIDMEVPEGARLGFVQAMYSGDFWITPPPQEGETIAMACPKLTRIRFSYLLDGVCETGKLRVLEVKEYARQQTPNNTVVTFQILYKKETIRMNIPYEITNEPE